MLGAAGVKMLWREMTDMQVSGARSRVGERVETRGRRSQVKESGLYFKSRGTREGFKLGRVRASDVPLADAGVRRDLLKELGTQ